MKVKAFIYLPDTDSAFESYTENQNFYKEVFAELFRIRQKLKNLEFELFYDSGNITSFLSVAQLYIPDSYLGFKTQVQTAIGKVSTDVNTPVQRSNQSTYANWMIDTKVFASPHVISEAVESTVNDNTDEKTCCICLGNSIATTRTELHIIKDSVQDPSLPILVVLDLINSDISFAEWTIIISPNKFSLRKNLEFQPIGRCWNKEMIYRHVASGNYWYFDFFHKDNKVHYEVFNEQGEHVGEADSNGQLQDKTKDAAKKITHILK